MDFLSSGLGALAPPLPPPKRAPPPLLLSPVAPLPQLEVEAAPASPEDMVEEAPAKDDEVGILRAPRP